MFKRKRISSSGAESPSMKVSKFFSGFFLKIIYCVIVSAIIFLIFNYFVFGFTNFVLVNIAETAEISKENSVFIVTEIFAIILGIYMVFRDRLRKR